LLLKKKEKKKRELAGQGLRWLLPAKGFTGYRWPRALPISAGEELIVAGEG